MRLALFRAIPKRAGFTLLELLVVVGLIAVLAGLVIGAGRRAVEAGHTARARAEIAALSVALENYRGAWGDYPRTADGAVLLQALIGRQSPAGTPMQGRSFIDLAKFTTGAGADPLTDFSAKLIDPWGRPYGYAYEVPATGWMNSGFVLYSVGPDGTDAPALLPGGFADSAQSANLDNIYANQH
jgi:general secretion pathway protein G